MERKVITRHAVTLLLRYANWHVVLHIIKNHTNENAKHNQGNTGWALRASRMVTQTTSCALFPKKYNTVKVNAKELRVKKVIKRKYLHCGS